MAGTPRPGVPTKLFAPVLMRAVREGFEQDYEGRLGALAERTGVPEDTIWGILHQRRETCDFDAADRLLCALNVTHLWREEPLRETYETLELWERCAAPGCLVYFHGHHIQQGKMRKRFCSPNCQSRVKKARAGGRLGTKTKRGFCRKGLHKMTPENTITKPDQSQGLVQCRACKNKAMRDWYHAKKEAQ